MKMKRLGSIILSVAIALSVVQMPVLAADTESAAETEPESSKDEATRTPKQYASAGWVKRYGDWYYRNSNGSYRTGWQKISGKWYYFDPDGYYMYSDGVYRIKSSRYNFTESGAMTTGWYKDPDSNSWIYSNSSGVVQTGWQKIGGKWYYLDPDSYYMYSDGMYKINGSRYYFTKSGAMTTGWYQDSYGDSWYYSNSSGVVQTGWQKIGGKWYYLDPDSYYMYSGEIEKINGAKYNFAKSGAMTTGWYEDPDYDFWYYSNSSGVIQTRWQYINGKWYYFDPSGYYMLADTYEYINGREYEFDSNGVCINP